MAGSSWAYLEQLRRYSEQLLRDHWDKKPSTPSQSVERAEPRFKQAKPSTGPRIRRK